MLLLLLFFLFLLNLNNDKNIPRHLAEKRVHHRSLSLASLLTASSQPCRRFSPLTDPLRARLLHILPILFRFLLLRPHLPHLLLLFHHLHHRHHHLCLLLLLVLLVRWIDCGDLTYLHWLDLGQLQVHQVLSHLHRLRHSHHRRLQYHHRHQQQPPSAEAKTAYRFRHPHFCHPTPILAPLPVNRCSQTPRLAMSKICNLAQRYRHCRQRHLSALGHTPSQRLRRNQTSKS